MRYLIPLVLSLASCFGLQTLALRAVGGHTIKSESNYFSSIARIQAGSADNPKIMLLGSSRTGRMPDRRSGFPGVANMGCDGASAAITLRAMDNGLITPPEILIIEGNTLVHDLESRGWEIEKCIGSFWFETGKSVPILSAGSRPAAFAYSVLLERKIGTQQSANTVSFPTFTSPVISEKPGVLPEQAEALVTELSGILGRLRKQGVKLMLVQLPPASDPETLNSRFPMALSRTAQIPFLDLSKGFPADALTYTDGIHLAPSSANAVLRKILSALQTL